MPRFVGFIGPSYKLTSVNYDCQRTINLIPELNEMGTGKEREVACFIGTPGKILRATTGINKSRGFYRTSTGRVFSVSGNKLYEITSAFLVIERGTLNTTLGNVSMADNGIQLVIVDGPNGYYLTLETNAFAVMDDEDFVGSDQVSYQDGYFIFNKPDSGQFYISDLNGIGVDALDFASSEGNPDKIVGHLSDHRDLWMFNERTIEVFYNSGATDFPFERIQGAFIEVGLGARFSIAKMDNTVFWLGQDDKGSGIVYMARGYQPERISTHAVEQAILSYGDFSSATAYVYQQGGHNYYILNFANANTTWVFDTSSKLWHERTYLSQGEIQRDRAQWAVFAFGKNLVADYENGNIYELSMDVYTDNGAPILRRRITPHLSDSNARLFYSSFNLDVETGVGLDGVGQGTDPKVMLQFSDDGGHTWSNEKWANLGKIGQRKARAKWERLGSSRDRVFSISISDPVKVVIIGADLNFEKGVA